MQLVAELFKNCHQASVSIAKVIHVFDREGDIAEVFESASEMENTGVVVRAAHNRCLLDENSYLWEYVAAQPVQFEREIELPQTKKRCQRIATLEIRFCLCKLRSPRHLKNQDSFEVYAVYAREINPPLTEEPVEWMLLTTESVTTPQEANQILRWYTLSKIGWFFEPIIFMPKPRQLPPLEDLQQRTDQVIKILELLEQEIQEILTTGKVAPAGCWIVRYQARGRKGT